MTAVMPTYGSANAIVAVDALNTKRPYTVPFTQLPDFFPDDGKESRAMNMFLAYVVSTSDGKLAAQKKYIKHTPRVLASLKTASATERTRQATRWNTAITAFNKKLQSRFSFEFAPVFPLVNVDTLTFGARRTQDDTASIARAFGQMQVFGDAVLAATERMRDVVYEVNLASRMHQTVASDDFDAGVSLRIDDLPDLELDQKNPLQSLDTQRGVLESAILALSDAFVAWTERYAQLITFAGQDAAVDEIMGELQ